MGKKDPVLCCSMPGERCCCRTNSPTAPLRQPGAPSCPGNSPGCFTVTLACLLAACSRPPSLHVLLPGLLGSSRWLVTLWGPGPTEEADACRLGGRAKGLAALGCGGCWALSGVLAVRV